MSRYRIEWCTWAGGEEADQCWHTCVPAHGVDYSARASVETEADLLRFDSAGSGWVYRVVETETEPVTVAGTVMVDRWDPRAGRWFKLEIAS